MSAIDFASARIGTLEKDSLLELWKKRARAARDHRRRFEKAWQEAQLFAAGQQWVHYNTRTHRTLVPDPETPEGQKRTHDVLMQFVWTVLGAMSTEDFRSRMVAGPQDNVDAVDAAKFIDKALGFAWDREFSGDQVVHDLLLDLVIYGTGSIRCRYDRSVGELLSEEYPHANGQPILDDNERVRAMEGSYSGNGAPVQMAPLREGKIVLEALSPWNRLPQPGVERSRDLRWDIVVRPVPVEDLRAMYPADAAGFRPESITSMDVLGFPQQEKGKAGGDELEDHCLVYTGYEKSGPRNPRGQTVVFTKDHFCGDPVSNLPYGENTGVVDFRWWPVPKRFWGRAFIEPGMEPQRTLNKRETQVDDIIDRGLPKVYLEKRWARKMKIPKGVALEVVELPDGAQPPQIDGGIQPGTWMFNDIARLVDSVPDALGVKRVSLGENPPGVGNYSQYVAVKEQEAVKLGPVSQRFNLGMMLVHELAVESMRQWPDSKPLLIEGEDGQLEVLAWKANKIPEKYVFQPAKRGSQPRGAGAELAKINDIWTAALNSGAVARNPDVWLAWYHDSLEAGKVKPLPDSGLEQQQHKAALENIVMSHSGMPAPVAPYDNESIHIPEHDREQSQLQQQALQSTNSQQQQMFEQIIQAIEQHKQMHVMQAQQRAAAQGSPGLGGSAPAPQLPPPMTPA